MYVLTGQTWQTPFRAPSPTPQGVHPVEAEVPLLAVTLPAGQSVQLGELDESL